MPIFTVKINAAITIDYIQFIPNDETSFVEPTDITQLSVVFNNNIFLTGNGSIRIYKYDDDSLVQTINSFNINTPVSFLVNLDNSLLNYDTRYYVLFDNVVKSVDDIEFIGISNKDLWNFEIEEEIINQPPTVTNITFPNGSCCDNNVTNDPPTITDILFPNGSCCENNIPIITFNNATGELCAPTGTNITVQITSSFSLPVGIPPTDVNVLNVFANAEDGATVLGFDNALATTASPLAQESFSFTMPSNCVFITAQMSISFTTVGEEEAGGVIVVRESGGNQIGNSVFLNENNLTLP